MKVEFSEDEPIIYLNPETIAERNNINKFYAEHGGLGVTMDFLPSWTSDDGVPALSFEVEFNNPNKEVKSCQR